MTRFLSIRFEKYDLETINLALYFQIEKSRIHINFSSYRVFTFDKNRLHVNVHILGPIDLGPKEAKCKLISRLSKSSDMLPFYRIYDTNEFFFMEEVTIKKS